MTSAPVERVPRVSVVIPNFHGGDLLRDAVRSVQAQTLTDWELLIVCDGPCDDLTDVERSEPRVRVFRQRNRGASIARNVGIRHARSALIALLDDDDRMLPDRLAAQVAVMDDTSIGLCHTQCRLINEHGTVIGEGAGRESQYNDFLRGDGAILLSSTMVRKELVEDVGGFNPLLPLGEDLDFLYRLARESAFRFLPEVLTEYRVHGANTWAGSAKGGAEVTSILTQHLFVARARAEHEHVAAINHGLSLIPSDRVAQAMLRAHDARARRRYAAMIVALAMAMVCAPVFTLKAVRRAVRKLARPSAVS